MDKFTPFESWVAVLPVDNIDTDYDAETFKHILCPIWIIAYQYRGKSYQGALNAVTGQTYAKFPISPWKVALVVGLLAFVPVAWIEWTCIRQRACGRARWIWCRSPLPTGPCWR